MAFYGYNTSNYDYGYGYDYDYAPAPSEASSTQYMSPYEYGEPELLEYNNASFTTPELNYSVYTSSEPQILQYDPIEHRYSHNYSEHYSVTPSHHDYGEPKFLISYSKVEFNEPDFEEYDPTPYGGGYDPVATYGKPLPPSEATCYPRFVPRSDSSSLENFSYSSIPSPYGNDDANINNDLPKKISDEAKPVDAKIDTETCVENVDDEVIGDEIKGGDYYYGDENEGKMNYVPYGSGLETIDICESIFGYWPCLAKIEQQKKMSNYCEDEERRMDPWKSAADYLFGGPETLLVCDYDNYHHHH